MSFHVSKVSKGAIKFGDGGEMTALAEGPCISLFCEGVYKRHVARLKCEGDALEKIMEVTNGLVHCEEFMIEGRVHPFGLQ
ncbi:hypothetical protein E2C01_038234 [Portunus trituberculatus]|uniref:Uncharacterized protein n=1 Tax=Portunus trituberculatus TaxID=210409 RepID=A0A5B7FHY9_PORTR|nr:hypothetical protein [Portunus trituberculatus]